MNFDVRRIGQKSICNIFEFVYLTGCFFAYCRWPSNNNLLLAAVYHRKWTLEQLGT